MSKNIKDTVVKYNINRGIGQLQGMSISPFIGGTKVNWIKLTIKSKFLLKINASFLNEPTGKIIIYEKKYRYNLDSTLNSYSTYNLTSGELEDSLSVKYQIRNRYNE